MRDAESAVIREKFIALNAYIRKERSKINNISFHLGNYKKKSKLNPKQAEAKNNKNQSENQWNWKQKINREKSMKPKAIFENISKIEELLARLKKIEGTS